MVYENFQNFFPSGSILVAQTLVRLPRICSVLLAVHLPLRSWPLVGNLRSFIFKREGRLAKIGYKRTRVTRGSTNRATLSALD